MNQIKKIFNSISTLIGRPWSEKWIRRSMIIAGIAAVSFIAYFTWNGYLSPEARLGRKQINAWENFEKFMAGSEAKQKADTFGGKTPEETISMFVAALEKGDLDEAGKYFELQVDGEYNKEWREKLNQAKERDTIKLIIIDFKELKPGDEDNNLSGNKWFVKYDSNNKPEENVLLEQNKFSNLWKISSM